MSTGYVYRVFLYNIINPKYGFGWDLPYYVGNLKVELLTQYHTRVVGTSPISFTSEIVGEVGIGRSKLSPLSTGSQSATWNNVDGVARYIRVYDSITPNLSASDPYLSEVDFGTDIILDNDTFTVFFSDGFLRFEGNLI